MYTHLPKTPHFWLSDHMWYMTWAEHTHIWASHVENIQVFRQSNITPWQQSESSLAHTHTHTQSGIITKSFHVLYCFKLTHLLFGESMQSRSILITDSLFKIVPLPPPATEKSSTAYFSKMYLHTTWMN